MVGKPKIEEKYERNGWPSIKRPDVKRPEGWSLELVVGVHRVRHQRLSPDGRHIAFIWDRDDLPDVYVMPAAGGWPQRISMDRSPAAFWDDEFPLVARSPVGLARPRPAPPDFFAVGARRPRAASRRCVAAIDRFRSVAHRRARALFDQVADQLDAEAAQVRQRAVTALAALDHPGALAEITWRMRFDDTESMGVVIDTMAALGG